MESVLQRWELLDADALATLEVPIERFEMFVLHALSLSSSPPHIDLDRKLRDLNMRREKSMVNIRDSNDTHARTPFPTGSGTSNLRLSRLDSTDRFVSTLAYQLARFDSRYHQSLIRILRTKDDILRRPSVINSNLSSLSQCVKHSRAVSMMALLMS